MNAVGAKRDVYFVARNYGRKVEFEFNPESKIVRNLYNDRKTWEPLILCVNAFPIEHNPTDKQLEHAGVTDPVDVLVYTPWLAWENQGIVYEDIERNNLRMRVRKEVFEVTVVRQLSHFGEDFLYLVFGGKR